jgi:hypothetical protein
MSNDISFQAQFGVICGAEAPVSYEGALACGLEWKRCAAELPVQSFTLLLGVHCVACRP